MRYREVVPAPLWLKGVVLAGVVSYAVAIGATAALSSLANGEAIVFYVFMSLGLATMLVSVLNFLSLEIQVREEKVRFAFGWFCKDLSLREISSAEVQRYNWLAYGGWGLRFSTRGRRAWSMPGVGAGVTIQTAEKSKPRSYFISSRSSAELAEAIREQARLAQWRRPGKASPFRHSGDSF